MRLSFIPFIRFTAKLGIGFLRRVSMLAKHGNLVRIYTSI